MFKMLRKRSHQKMKVAMRKMSLPIKKMMNQHLKSNKILQDLPTRIIMAAMTIKSSDKKCLLLKTLKRPPHQTYGGR